MQTELPVPMLRCRCPECPTTIQVTAVSSSFPAFSFLDYPRKRAAHLLQRHPSTCFFLFLIGRTTTRQGLHTIRSVPYPLTSVIQKVSETFEISCFLFRDRHSAVLFPCKDTILLVDISGVLVPAGGIASCQTYLICCKPASRLQDNIRLFMALGVQSRSRNQSSLF